MAAPAPPLAWDVDFTPAPAFAVSLRLPVGVLQGLVAEAAAAAAERRAGVAGPTLAVVVPAAADGPPGSAVRGGE